MRIVDLKVDEFSFKNYIMRDAAGHAHPGLETDSVAFMIRIIAENGAEGRYFSDPSYVKPNANYNVPKSTKSRIFTKGFSMPEILRSVIRTLVVGEDVYAREKIFNKINQMQRLNAAITEKVLAYVDCALWDLAGQLQGLPVYKLLGGHRTKIKAYASTMVGDYYEGGLATPEDFAKYALYWKNEKNFKALKLHTWAEKDWEDETYRAKGDWKQDAKACHAVRDVVGNDMELMLDCYHYYDRYDAYKLGKELEKANFAWLEEPMDEYNVSSYKWLCDNLTIPICGPEVTLGKSYTRAEWIKGGACDIVRTGAFDVGGLTSALKTAHLCEAFGMPLELHSPGPCNIHLLAAMTIPGEYYEYGLVHPFFDWATPPWLNSSIDQLDGEGYILVPQSPGMGWDINFDYINDNMILSK